VEQQIFSPGPARREFRLCHAANKRRTFCLRGQNVRYIELFVKRNVSFFNAVSLEPPMTLSLSRRQALGVVLGGAIAAPSVLRAQALKEIRIDWATYNPLSLILRDQKLLEKEFEKDNIAIRWVQSAGSNKALEFLNAGSLDFGSTAGAAALLGKINGNPIQSVSVYSRPEWTALVTKPGKGVAKVADLKGKAIAVTRGTDPHIFLIRALAEAGLKERDAKLVLLQHADGRTALARGDVDAWAGLDPLMAAAELEDGAVLFHRKPEHNTWGVLNTPTAFAEKNPEIVKRVITVYEAARKAAIANIRPVQEALVAAARLPEAVIARQLTRTDLSTSVIGTVQAEAIHAAGVALQEAGVIKADIDVKAVVSALIEPKFTAHLAA
jgi:sulfonate transport system substrate-binding protein